MVRQLALITAALFVFLQLATACSISPNPASGTVGNAVSLQIILEAGDLGKTVDSCGTGGTASAVNENGFTCTYSSSGSKIVTVSTNNEGSVVTCSSAVNIASLSDGAPSISISQPSGNSVTRGANVIVSGTASDNEGINRVGVAFSCGGSFIAQGTTSWSYNWPVPSSGASSCTITATATDTNGQNTSVSKIVNFQAGGGAGCVPLCSDRQKVTCPSGSVAPVECCSVSDCETQCTADNKVREATCNVGNQCVYGDGVYRVGQCGYQRSCSLLTSASEVRQGEAVGVTVNYNGFTAAAPGNVAVQCGNSEAATASNCNGASGSCSTECRYNVAGSYRLSTGIQGTSCTGVIISVLAVAQQPVQNQPSSLGQVQPRESEGLSSSASCRLSVPSEVRVNSPTLVGIEYTNLPSAGGNVAVQCGNGRSAATTCSGTTGSCRVECIYTSSGRFMPSASLSGVTCSASEVQVLPPARGLFDSPQDANVSITRVATQPSVIIESTATSLSALVESDESIQSVACTSPNSRSICSCSLTPRETGGLLDCSITPPVNGAYLLHFTSASGKTREVEVTLNPGAIAEVKLVTRGFDYTFWAVAALAFLLAGYALYYGAGKLQDKLTVKEKLLKRRNAIIAEINTAKIRYMKGEILQSQFQQQYNAKQKELTEINAKINLMDKK